MAAAVFLCDGAQMPPRWQGETDRPAQHLSHSGLDPEVNLQIEDLSRVLLGSIDGRAADLVKIASYAYSADQSVSRGGEADVYGRKWHRQMRLAIPVSDPRFWQRRSTSTALQVTLGFVSDDAWEFHFTKAKAAQSQLLLRLPENEIHSDPDCVVLFSGGADSLSDANFLRTNAGIYKRRRRSTSRGLRRMCQRRLRPSGVGLRTRTGTPLTSCCGPSMRRFGPHTKRSRSPESCR